MPKEERRAALKLSKAPEVTLLGWGGVLNGVWEFLHSPLYTDHARGAWYIIWTRLHCTVGDLMILLAAFWVTCLVFRTRYWIRQPRASAALLFLGIGLCYTVYSEWYNTTVSKTWQYTPLMPVVFGIGLSPLLQWLLIPPISLWGVRRSMIVRSGAS